MSCDIQEVTERPLYPWYDYNQAVLDSAGYLKLFTAGCQLDSGWNCTTACLDTENGIDMVWSRENSTYTLNNCMVPFIASLLVTGELSPPAKSLAAKYAIGASDDLWRNRTLGWPVINNCIDSFCAVSNDTTLGCYEELHRRKYPATISSVAGFAPIAPRLS
jgi:hypothetical protein